MTQWRFAILPILTAVLAGCGGGSGGYGTGPSSGPSTNPGGGGDPTGANANVVTISNQSFSPGSMTVSAGSSVTWKWSDCSGDGYGYSTCVGHNVTFDDGSNVASATQEQGTFNRVFAAKGTFKYHCSIHGPAMSGQIVVQ